MSVTQVEAQFVKANSYATTAQAQAATFINALQSTVSGLTVPNLDMDLSWPTAPNLGPNVSFNVDVPGYAFPTDDSGAPPSAPDATINTGGAPSAVSLPEYTYTPGTEPMRPVDPGELTAITLPAEPGDWVPPTTPALLSVAIRPFDGVNGFGEWVDRLSVMPADLNLASPTPFSFVPNERYTSALLAETTAQIRARLAGGTGLAPAVEQAIWDRARSREAIVVQNNIDDVVRNTEARGFALPPGALHAQMREAQKQGYAKMSEVSRDIAIKQAELEQANAKHAIEQGTALEGKLIDYANNIEQRAFEAAKAVAANAVEIYNALVAQYRTMLDKYTTYAGVYRSLVEGERARVDAYRAEVDAERTKVDVNKALIDQQRAQIEVRTAEIELYKSELQGVQTVLSVDKLKLEAFGERVRAYVAELNAETVRTEVFKAQNASNQIKAEVYKTSVDAWAQRIQAESAVAKNRADIYDAQVRGFLARTQRYATAVNAEAEKVRAGVSIAGLQVEAGKALIQQNSSNNQLQIENYKALIGLYEANKSLAVQKAKVLADNYLALKSLVADASKVAAQVNAQLAASAYGTIQANAGIQSSDSMSSGHSISYAYSGATTADVVPKVEMPLFV